MPQHIWTSDVADNLNYFNKSVFGFSGLSLEEIKIVGWLDIFYPDDREENIKNDYILFLMEHNFLFNTDLEDTMDVLNGD